MALHRRANPELKVPCTVKEQGHEPRSEARSNGTRQEGSYTFVRVSREFLLQDALVEREEGNVSADTVPCQYELWDVCL